MVKILLASDSSIKENSVKQWFKENKNMTISIKKVKIEDNLLPLQPLNTGGNLTCSDRIKYLKNNIENLEKYNYLISIENSIKTYDDYLVDMVYIKIYDILNKKEYIEEGGEIEITYKLLNKYKKLPNIIEEFMENYQLTSKKYIFDGCQITFGELINKYYPNIQSNNWTKNVVGIDRKIQILSVLNKLNDVIN